MTTMEVRQSLLARTASVPLEDPATHALLSIGFRPFFLLAALCAIFWVPLWLLLLSGMDADLIGAGTFAPAALHGHEMIFGFTVAVISGFLLTAGANWTGRPTTNGKSLAGLTLLWLAGRVCMLSPAIPSTIAALVDLSFLPILAAVLGRSLVLANSRRNFAFLLMLLMLTLANALTHAENSEEFRLLTGVLPQTGTTLGLRIVTLMMLVMGGRVIPMFTKNATRRSEIHASPWLERWAISSFVLAASVDILWRHSTLGALLLIGTGLVQFLRMRTWGTRHAKDPLLWILHGSFLFIASSLVLDGLGALGLVSRDMGRHLLTVGGIGGLCLGMMTRVSLGHSGRMLKAPTKMTVAFFLILAAGIIRASSPMLTGSVQSFSYQASGILWTLSFIVFLIFGFPIWTKPRVDADRRGAP